MKQHAIDADNLHQYINDTYEQLTLSTPEPNKLILLGELLGIEESGFYRGNRYSLVLMRTVRAHNKPHYLWLILPENDETLRMVQENQVVYIEGHLIVTPSFNNRAISHTFVEPSTLLVVPENIGITEAEDFPLNYTLCNRVVLEGKVIGVPWKETIPPLNKSVTRFPMLIQVNNTIRKIYCTIWEDMNTIGPIENGMILRVLGSYTMLKKERNLTIKDGYVTNCLKNKLDSYVVLVQQLQEVPLEQSIFQKN